VTSVTGSVLVPRPRRCDTPSCDRDPVEPVHKARGIDQSDGALPAFVFTCDCGWKRIEPVRVVLLTD
jgi:hypothetical protein